MSFLVDRCVKRSHAMQELYEAWQAAHKQAVLANDVEEMCGEWLELGQLCQHVWRGLLSALFQNTIDDTEGLGRAFHEAVSRARKVGLGISGLVSEMNRRGFVIEKAGSLRAVLQDIEALERDIPVKWPMLDKTLLVEARAAYNRGEYQSLEDVLNAAHSESSCPGQPSHRPT